MMLSSAMPANKKPPLVNIGDRFQRLSVIGFSHHDKRWRRHYLVKCDCGSEKTVQGALLRSGNTRSCGCLAKDVRSSKKLSDNYGEVTQIILQYKRHAKDRGIQFLLSREEVDDIVRMPCYYCGEVAGNLKKTKNCKEGFAHNGIDRTDSSKPYISENVVACCGVCNVAKGKRSAEDFISWASRISSVCADKS